MKTAVYIFWNTVFVFFSLFWGYALIGNNNMGETCIPIDESTIKNSCFHWYWEGNPCYFDISYIICFYIVIFIVYTILKGYGYKKEKYVISPRFMFFELLTYFLVYYIYLLKQIINSKVFWNFDILFNGFLGGLQFFLPMLIYGGLISFAGYKEANKGK